MASVGMALDARPSVAARVASPAYENVPAAAYLHLDKRFQRLNETVEGGALHQGGFGKVFQAYDLLRQEFVMIKRQRTDTDAVEREVACFNMLTAFPHEKHRRHARDVGAKLE